MGTHPIFESDFDCLTDLRREKKMKKGGTARKSTHSKAKRIEKSARPVVKEIDETAHYEIEKIGPVHLKWGKRSMKNSKGKMVKKWYIDKTRSKHLIWVEWREPFEDKDEKDDDFQTMWSAEDQKTLNENKSNQIDVEKALNSKVVWPWVKKEDEGYEERRDLLKKGGYKEWKPTSKTNGKTSGQSKWKIKFPIEPKTDTSGNSSDSDTTSTDAAEEEEEEDDEV